MGRGKGKGKGRGKGIRNTGRASGFQSRSKCPLLAWANVGGLFGLMVLSCLLGVVGLIFCYVGAILVMPISMAAQAVAYRRVFPEIQVEAAAPVANDSAGNRLYS